MFGKFEYTFLELNGVDLMNKRCFRVYGWILDLNRLIGGKLYVHHISVDTVGPFGQYSTLLQYPVTLCGQLEMKTEEINI